MKPEEEARLDITENLVSQAMAKHHVFVEDLRIAATEILKNNGQGPVEITAVVLSLLRVAAAITYGTVESKVDMQIRTTSEFGNLAASMWSFVAMLMEEEVRKMQQSGIEVPDDISAKIKAAPSDENLTPSTMPKETVVPRRHTLDDLLERISASAPTAQGEAN